MLQHANVSLPIVLVLAATPAWAQTPPVANAPVSGADFLRADGGDPVPDTTAPWRYFPLHVGNAWEYYSYGSGERRRVDVLGEETIKGRHYFMWHERYYDADGNATGTWGPRAVRFDTTTATARYLPLVGEEQWMVPCPLDVPFGSEVACPEREELPYEVGGGYDGLLAFGGEFPGTGTDTVRTAVKTYYSFHPGNTLDYRYAADIGFVFAEGELGASGIYYAKVDGVEHGQAFYPVADEPGPPEQGERLALSAFPNPFGEWLTVAFELSQAGPVVVEVVDMLGRVIRRRDLGVIPPGHHEIGLDGEALGAGVYFLRVMVAGAPVAVRPVTRL